MEQKYEQDKLERKIQLYFVVGLVILFVIVSIPVGYYGRTYIQEHRDRNDRLQTARSWEQQWLIQWEHISLGLDSLIASGSEGEVSIS